MASSPYNQKDTHSPPRVAVLGATLGTGNLGVDALGKSMVQGLVGAIPNVEVVYQCWDLRLPVEINCGASIIECEPVAIRRKNSLRSRDGLLQIRRMARLRSWLANRSMPQLPTVSQTLKQLLSCDAVLDVSAGDSFANIYGDEVFWYQAQLKLLCLELGLPLVLMPQTYGPFSGEETKQIAAGIISRATLVCSREQQGLTEVRQLCGDHPPQRLVRVPDMAFLLEPEQTELPPRMQQALDDGRTCIAINISGLLYYARRSFGLRDDYKQFCHRLIEWALTIPESLVVLVPHVVAPTYYARSKNPGSSIIDTTDTAACEAATAEFGGEAAERIVVLPNTNGPAKVKHAMMRCDYFIGARMHAFIGASSLCVPGSLLAYSKKAEGLANLLGIGDSVVDLRSTDNEQSLKLVDEQFRRREQTKEHLRQRVPEAKSEVRRFFSDVIAPIVFGKGVTKAMMNDDSHNFEDDAEIEGKRVLN